MRKKTPTYKHQVLIMFCIFILLAGSGIFAKDGTIRAASSMNIRYKQKTTAYTGIQLSANVDGKAINLDKTPGVALKNTSGTTVYMVPAYEVFQQGCQMQYSNKNNTITMKKYGITLKMTVNSRTAYIDGKKITLDYEPTYIKYMASGKQKLCVPAKNVASAFGYSYAYVKNSSEKTTIKMTSSYYVKYDGIWKKYTGTKAALTFDGEKVEVSNMPCIVIDNCFYIQAKAVDQKEIGGTYKYQPSSRKVTLAYQDNTVIMTMGSKTAYVNGKAVSMAKPAKLLYNSKNSTQYVMVPVSFTAKRLGLDYAYDSTSKTCVITRKDSTYFEWKAENEKVKETISDAYDEGVLVASEEVSADYAVTEVVGKRISNNDVIAISGHFLKENITVSNSGSIIRVVIADVENPLGTRNITLSHPYLLSGVSMSQNTERTTVIEIAKKDSKISYIISQEDGYLSVSLTKKVVKNGYKIAVDAGHGPNTAGKRTPAILENLDFDLDGKIDAYKGSQIKENTANVGVGNYAVAALERCGFEVYQSGFGTTDTALTTRQANIKAAGCDYSISIHFNAAGNGTSFNTANGMEVFTHTAASKAANSKALAKTMLANVIKGTPQKNRGVNSQHAFAMCNAAAMGTKGSILLECAFMTNWTEVKTMMASTAYWKETGEEIAKGFCEYLGVAYVAP